MSFSMKGQTGGIRVGGREALSLRQWTFTASGDGWRVVGTVAERNDLWLDSGGPFELHLSLAASEWRFRDVSVSADQTAATITGTSQPEER